MPKTYEMSQSEDLNLGTGEESLSVAEAELMALMSDDPYGIPAAAEPPMQSQATSTEKSPAMNPELLQAVLQAKSLSDLHKQWSPAKLRRLFRKYNTDFFTLKFGKEHSKFITDAIRLHNLEIDDFAKKIKLSASCLALYLAHQQTSYLEVRCSRWTREEFLYLVKSTKSIFALSAAFSVDDSTMSDLILKRFNCKYESLLAEANVSPELELDKNQALLAFIANAPKEKSWLDPDAVKKAVEISETTQDLSAKLQCTDQVLRDYFRLNNTDYYSMKFGNNHLERIPAEIRARGCNPELVAKDLKVTVACLRRYLISQRTTFLAVWCDKLKDAELKEMLLKSEDIAEITSQFKTVEKAVRDYIAKRFPGSTYESIKASVTASVAKRGFFAGGSEDNENSKENPAKRRHIDSGPSL